MSKKEPPQRDGQEKSLRRGRKGTAPAKKKKKKGAKLTGEDRSEKTTFRKRGNGAPKERIAASKRSRSPIQRFFDPREGRMEFRGSPREGDYRAGGQN